MGEGYRIKLKTLTGFSASIQVAIKLASYLLYSFNFRQVPVYYL